MPQIIATIGIGLLALMDILMLIITIGFYKEKDNLWIVPFIIGIGLDVLIYHILVNFPK